MSLRAMLVDDNPSFLDAARAVLEREHVTVVALAATGAEALRRADELALDVALVDITLEHESGFDVVRRLAARTGGAGPALILISTHAEVDFSDLIADSPAIGFLPKSDLCASAIHGLLGCARAQPSRLRARAAAGPACRP